MTTVRYRLPAKVRTWPVKQKTDRVALGEFEETFEIADGADPMPALAVTNAVTDRQTSYYWDGESFLADVGLLSEKEPNLLPWAMKARRDISRDYKLKPPFRPHRFFPEGAAEDFMAGRPRLLSRSNFLAADLAGLDADRVEAEAYLATLVLVGDRLFRKVGEPFLTVSVGAGTVAVRLEHLEAQRWAEDETFAIFGVNRVAEANAHAYAVAEERAIKAKPLADRLDLIEPAAFSDNMQNVVLEYALRAARGDLESALAKRTKNPETFGTVTIEEIVEVLVELRSFAGRQLAGVRDGLRAEEVIRRCLDTEMRYELSVKVAKSVEALMEQWEARPISFAGDGLGVTATPKP